MEKKKIAITMGDPGGIGPEVIVKALASEKIVDTITPVIIGCKAVMEDALSLFGAEMLFEEDLSAVSTDSADQKIFLIDIHDSKHLKKGMATPEGGAASVKCIKKAVQMCLDKEVNAMVTAPISKEAVHRAGYQWPGHTEMIAELTESEKVGMLFVGKSFNVILVTIHVPLLSVPNLINEEKVFNTIILAERACEMLSVHAPKIAVAGLNPHAGESGLFGTTEQSRISPAIARAQDKGITVNGPFPPDVIFKKAADGEYDIVVAMYHDQGLIPFKLLHFETGVNATIGLPIIRTSPDHGTAYDISWKGNANPSSMIEAIRVAERMKL